MKISIITTRRSRKVLGLFIVTASLLFQKAHSKNMYVDPEVRNFPVVPNPNPKVIQLISHGRPGELLLKGKWCNASEIVSFMKEQHLVSGRETSVNIYGCEFAKGEKGMQAIATIGKELGIDVAASTNITGKHGDWILEKGKAANVLNMAGYPYDLQTICMDTIFTPVTAGWTNPQSSPSYSPPSGCINNNGATSAIGSTNYGFYTEYDNPSGYVWARTLNGLNAANSYRVRVAMTITQNGNDLRNCYFQNYNMAGKTGTFTANGGGNPYTYTSYNFIVTNQTSLSFSGTIVAAAWNNCDQAQGYWVDIFVDQVGAITPTYSAPTLTDSVGTNVCPALTTNLSGEASGCGTGSTLEWHTTNIGYSNATRLTNTTSVANGTYYAICHNTSKACYSSPSAALTVNNVICTPLPIDFKNSDAYWRGNDANILWTVANEVNNNYFGIERSFDGKNFNEIAQVKSMGNHSNDRDYSFVDAGAKLRVANTVFYRIKQHDINGNTTTSQVIMLSANDSKGLAYVYPNPASTSQFNFVYQNNTAASMPLDVQIVDAYGRSLYQTKKQITAGKNIIPVEISGLGAGMYFLKYVGKENNVKGVIRIVKK